MFKYLWIVILSLIAIAFMIVAIADIVESYKNNYKFYIKQKRGGWKDVVKGTFKNLDESTIAILFVIVTLITIASFVVFIFYFGGVE